MVGLSSVIEIFDFELCVATPPAPVPPPATESIELRISFAPRYTRSSPLRTASESYVTKHRDALPAATACIISLASSAIAAESATDGLAGLATLNREVTAEHAVDRQQTETTNRMRARMILPHFSASLLAPVLNSASRA